MRTFIVVESNLENGAPPIIRSLQAETEEELAKLIEPELLKHDNWLYDDPTCEIDPANIPKSFMEGLKRVNLSTYWPDRHHRLCPLAKNERCSGMSGVYYIIKELVNSNLVTILE